LNVAFAVIVGGPEMPNPKSSKQDKRADKAAKAVQRAIKKTQLVNERPTVGKPVIVNPANDGAPTVGDKHSPR
jgi:hypothetical protein